MIFTKDISDISIIYILRHRKERLSKCSLHGLENRSDLRFFNHPDQTDEMATTLLKLPSPVCLTLNAPVLQQSDCLYSLVVLDATWRLSIRLFSSLDRRLKGYCQHRSLPEHLLTAYPRRQSDCPSPGRGLASIEALAAARQIANNRGVELLADYKWRDEFLLKNKDFFEIKEINTQSTAPQL